MNDQSNAASKLIYEAVRFASWAAGEGIAPRDEANARAPEDFLFEYSCSTGDEEWETLAERVRASYVPSQSPSAFLKPLVWAADDDGSWRADTPFGYYAIWKSSTGTFRLVIGPHPDVGKEDREGTLEDLKAHAEADFASRVRAIVVIDLQGPVAWGENIGGRFVSAGVEKTRHNTVALYAPETTSRHPYADINLAIDFACDHAGSSAGLFLNEWRHGNWNTIDKEWPTWRSFVDEKSHRTD